MLHLRSSMMIILSIFYHNVAPLVLNVKPRRGDIMVVLLLALQIKAS